jgi:hypothetical protein
MRVCAISPVSPDTICLLHIANFMLFHFSVICAFYRCNQFICIASSARLSLAPDTGASDRRVNSLEGWTYANHHPFSRLSHLPSQPLQELTHGVMSCLHFSYSSCGNLLIPPRLTYRPRARSSLSPSSLLVVPYQTFLPHSFLPSQHTSIPPELQARLSYLTVSLLSIEVAPDAYHLLLLLASRWSHSSSHLGVFSAV